MALTETGLNFAFRRDAFPDGPDGDKLYYELERFILSYRLLVTGVVVNEQQSITALPRITTAHWHYWSAYGSTATMIPTYTTELDASDDVVVTVVNSSVDGFSVTANMDCYVVIKSYMTYSGTTLHGISKNASSTTTAIHLIAAAERYSFVTVGTDAVVVGAMTTGDILRPHTTGVSPGGNADRCRIQLLALEKL